MDDNYIRDKFKGGRIVATIFFLLNNFCCFFADTDINISFYAHLPVYIGFFNVLSD